MTPEREKHLASIGKEERIIRDHIKNLKGVISYSKDGFYDWQYDQLSEEELKSDIRECKVVIRALKRQLPVPTLKFHTPCSDHLVCGICNNISDLHANYCYHCGCKFRK